MFIAADLAGQRHDLLRAGQVAGRRAIQAVAYELFVPADERALFAANGGVTERVERRAAQALQLRQHAQRPAEPAAQL